MDLSKPLYGSKDAPRLPISEANARELHQIEFLAGLDARMNGNPDVLRERLKDVPDGWRQYRIAMAAVAKVLDGVYRTLPTRTLHHMARLNDNGEVVIRMIPPVKTGDAQIVGNKELRVLINAAIEGHCALCLKSGGEVRSCPLRRALILVAPPQDFAKDGMCPYQHVAAGNALGEYI